MKKAPYLKTLYLQKPLVLIMLIAAIATLPWLGVSTYLLSTEQFEMSVIQSFLKSGDLSLLNAFESHSTLSRLLVVGFSYFTGEVTPYVLRLPSALSFIAIMGFCFMFFAHRRPVLEAFTSVLILITSSGLFFSSIFYNAYLLPSFFIIGGIFEMYRWLETRKIGKLITTWLFWGGAVFELGWLVLIPPFISFLVYLIIRRKSIGDILFNPLLMAVPALLIGLLLFWALPHSDLHTFWDCRAMTNGVSLENFTLQGKILAPFSGFLPWTLVLVVALLAAPFIEKSKEVQAYNYPPVLPLDKVSQYNLLAAVIPFIGFLILPSSVLSEVFFIVCLVFTAVFLSRLIVHLSDMYPLVLRIFSVGLTIVSIFVMLFGTLALFGLVPFQGLEGAYAMQGAEGGRWVIGLILTAGLLVAIAVNISFLFRRKNLKVLMSTVGLFFAMQLFIGIEMFPYLLEWFRFLGL